MNLLDYFFYNRDVYAKQIENGDYVSGNGPITEELINDHLSGKLTLACNPDLEGMCTLGCVQFDYIYESDPSEPWTAKPQHSFSLLVRELIGIGILYNQIYSEWGAQGGTHIWLFFMDPVPSLQVIQIFNYCLSKVKCHSSIKVSIFPSEGKNESNFIRLPFANKFDNKQSNLRDANGNTLGTNNLEFNTISYFNFQRILRQSNLVPPARYTPTIELNHQCLLDKCKIISDWYSKPDGIPDVILWGIGTNLIRLGDSGIAAWRHLMDGLNEDEFRQHLDKVKQMPICTCIKFDCYRRCMVGAPINHLKKPKLPIEFQNTSDITLEKIKDYYYEATALVIEDYTPSLILNNGFPGLGKTNDLAEQLLTNTRYSVAWMAPNHIQAQQVIDIWGSEAVHLKSRQQMCKERLLDCPHIAEINQAFNQGLPGGLIYCKANRCDQFKNCTYLKTYKKAQSSRLVLCMHQHNMYGTVEELNKDILVIDENPANCLRKNARITTADIRYSLKLANKIKNEFIKDQVSSTLEYIKDNQVESIENEIWPIYGLDRMQLNQDVNRAASNFSIDHGKWLLGDLEYLSSTGKRIYSTDSGFYYSKQSWIPTDRPVFVLDATLDMVSLRMLLPQHELLHINPDILPPQQCEVTQYVGATYGASTLFNVATKTIKPTGKRLIRAIKEIIGEDAAIISFKKLIEIAKDQGIFPDFSAVGWYGNTRGLNNFHVHDNLVILGFWMKPVEIMVKGAFEHHGIPDTYIGQAIRQVERELELPYYDAVQNTEGSKVMKIKSYRFSNPYVESYYHYSVLSELTQAIGRARVFMPCEKTRKVWIITDIIPDHVQPTRYIDKNELIPDIRKVKNHKAIKEAMKITLNPHSPKDIHQTLLKMGKGKISLRTVKTYYKDFVEE